jgi:predicted RND superfamily exporter protein
LQALVAAESLQRALLALPGVDATFSCVDTLKALNRAFHGEAPGQFCLPTDTGVLDELLEFLESDPSEMSSAFLSADRRSLRILARTNLFGSRELQQVIRKTQQLGTQLLPPGFSVQVASSLTLLNATSDRVAIEQSRSLALSAIAIAIMVLLLFRSWQVGLLAMLLASWPILLFFGLMGWTGIALNVNTCVIASIALGITVDNCVHYLVHFQHGRRAGLSLQDAARQGLTESGVPMLASAVALGLGFLVVAFSRFVPVAHFGLLSAFIMGANLLADLFLLPLLVLLLRERVVPELQAVQS